MNITQHNVGTVLVLTPEAERLDAAVAPTFKGHMVDTINAGNTLVVVDLTKVDFMDSSGLAALMSSLKTLHGQGRLALCGLSEKVRKLFAITKLDRGAFPIFNTPEEAAAALGKAT